MGCTTVLVGKKASYDGSTMIARNDDSGGPTGFCPKRLAVIRPEDQPKVYRSNISECVIPLPADPMRYTAVPNVLNNKGIWGSAGVNSANVAMTATETLSTNPRVLGADPLLITRTPLRGDTPSNSEMFIPEDGPRPSVPEHVKYGGIGEEDIVVIVLPYIRSAREGVIRLASLLEEYGTYENNGIAFQDRDEIWWMATIGGHHWIARRLPDDCYAVIPNQLWMDRFDLDDALSEQREFMCSSDMREFIAGNHLSLTEVFNPRVSLGSCDDGDRIYNTPRAWSGTRILGGLDKEYPPESFEIPWCLKPDRLITVEDVKYVLSDHFQNTGFDPYSGKPESRKYRPIGISRTNFVSITQIRPYVPDHLSAIEWLAYCSNVFNVCCPFYTDTDVEPEYISETAERVSTESFYWASALIGALADSHFYKCIQHIERYQESVAGRAHAIINRYDAAAAKGENVVISDANNEIARMVKEETDNALRNVLGTATLDMKNAFKRADT